MTEIKITRFEDKYGPKIRLTFTYDPRVVAAIKRVEHRRYNADTKTWSIPAGKLEELAGELPGVEFVDPATETRTEPCGAKIPEAPKTEFPAELAVEIRVLATRLLSVADRLQRMP